MNATNMTQQSNFFDQFAENYDTVLTRSISVSGEESSFFCQLKISLLQRYLAQKLPSKCKILDYGCGTGRATEYLNHHFPNSIVYGVDPSAQSIAQAQKKFPKAQFEVLLGHNFGDEKFDLIFASCVFHHIAPDARQQIAQNLAQQLNRGGFLVLFEHNPFNPLTVKVVKDCPFDKGVTLLKAKESIGILTAAGCTQVRLHYYFFFPKIMSFLRPLESFLNTVPLGAQYMAIGTKLENCE